jgi:polysaccharide pyruvyl transferase WcaK-like protein
MKIVVFNVKYSENLGDGILAECLESELARQGDDIAVTTIDLAGRKDYGHTHGGRGLGIAVLKRLPAFARRWAVSAILGPKLARLQPEWQRQIAAADAVVIGGGNLMQDDDLNFPLKVGMVLDCLKTSRTPVVIHAVGVSGHWSGQARALFGRLAKTNVAAVSVRDDIAARNWARHFPDGPAATVLPDPGLLARDLVAAAPRRDGQAPVVGLCVTAPVILVRHADIAASAIPLTTPHGYRDLALGLLAKGYQVRLFCNGAREDQAFAEEIVADAALAESLADGRLRLLDRPLVPADVMGILETFSAIVAHRLHACIAAYSLGVPAVGLGWDQKVAGFFRSVGRADFYLDGSGYSVPHAIALVDRAVREGIEPDRHAATLQAARSAVAAILSALGRPHRADPASPQAAAQLGAQSKPAISEVI